MRRSVFVLTLLAGTLMSGYTDQSPAPATGPVTATHRAVTAPATPPAYVHRTAHHGRLT